MLFNTFPKTQRDNFILFRTDRETASKFDIIDFMEKKKELTNEEHSRKTRVDNKKKKMEDQKKNRGKEAGNKDCQLHPGQRP